MMLRSTEDFALVAVLDPWHGPAQIHRKRAVFDLEQPVQQCNRVHVSHEDALFTSQQSASADDGTTFAILREQSADRLLDGFVQRVPPDAEDHHGERNQRQVPDAENRKLYGAAMLGLRLQNHRLHHA